MKIDGTSRYNKEFTENLFYYITLAIYRFAARRLTIFEINENLELYPYLVSSN